MELVPPDPHALGGSLSEVRQRKLEATAALLGDTIQLSDQAWQEPSLLPGWTRAHVATHVARNADGLRDAFVGLRQGRPQLMYSSEADRERDIERGSQRNGLELQIDLDTSALGLKSALDELERADLDQLIELRAGFRIPVRLLPLARLNEVVLHHIDLDTGFEARHISQPTARWLVEWTLLRLDDRIDIPALEIHSESGLDARIGGFGDPTTVSGPDNLLLGWLTGRSSGDGLEGASDLTMPLLG